MSHIIPGKNISIEGSEFLNLMMRKSQIFSLFLINDNGEILEVNTIVEKSFGYTPKDIVGKNFSLLFTDEDKKHGKPQIELKNVLEKGYATDYNYIVHKNGNLIWVNGESILLNPEADESYFVKIIYDVNDQKLLEDILTESNELGEGIIEAIPQPIVVLSGDMKIIKANIEFCNSFYLSCNNVKDNSFLEINNNFFSRPELINILKDISIKNAVKNYEFEYNNLNHEKKIISLNIRKLLNAIPSATKILIVFTDISSHETYQKLNKEKENLNKINNDLDTFVYTASHDLKTPINNIEGLVNALKDTSTDEEGKLLITMIEESIHKFKTTLEDLSSSGKAQEADDQNSVYFQHMLNEIKFDLKDQITSTGAIIREDFSEAEQINFSRKNLRSIIFNLISNAIKYRSPKRIAEIHVSTKIIDQYILLSVRDNGLGIAEEDKDKVFSMYKRLHDHVEGTGVGMNIVKRIIDNNNGKIELESQLGLGSVFKIYFKIY